MLRQSRAVRLPQEGPEGTFLQTCRPRRGLRVGVHAPRRRRARALLHGRAFAHTTRTLSRLHPHLERRAQLCPANASSTSFATAFASAGSASELTAFDQRSRPVERSSRSSCTAVCGPEKNPRSSTGKFTACAS